METKTAEGKVQIVAPTWGFFTDTSVTKLIYKIKKERWKSGNNQLLMGALSGGRYAGFVMGEQRGYIYIYASDDWP